jgi:hypothetical protein
MSNPMELAKFLKGQTIKEEDTLKVLEGAEARILTSFMIIHSI